jgi:hypothetical protein
MKYEQHKNQELCAANNHLNYKRFELFLEAIMSGCACFKQKNFHSANDGFKNFTIERDFILFPEFVQMGFRWICWTLL